MNRTGLYQLDNQSLHNHRTQQPNEFNRFNTVVGVICPLTEELYLKMAYLWGKIKRWLMRCELFLPNDKISVTTVNDVRIYIHAVFFLLRSVNNFTLFLLFFMDSVLSAVQV